MGYNAVWSGKGKGLPLTGYESTHGEYKYSSFYSRAGLVVNLTLLPLYPGIEQGYPLYRGLGRPQSRSERK